MGTKLRRREGSGPLGLVTLNDDESCSCCGVVRCLVMVEVLAGNRTENEMNRISPALLLPEAVAID